MAEQTIGDRQEELQRWYLEWLSINTGSWKTKTAESLLSYLKMRLCVTLHPLPEAS